MIQSILAGELITPIRVLKNALLTVENGKVLSIDRMGLPIRKKIIDYSDAILIPGLVDLQVNGAKGWSFQSDHLEHFEEILAYHLAAGTTTLLPTLVTAPEEVLLSSLRLLGVLFAQAGFFSIGEQRITLPGIHLEGPFLSPEKRGAHDENFLRLPDPGLAGQYIEAANGKIKIFTLAPELPGAETVIRELAGMGVVVAAGHSAAHYTDLRRAIDSGLRMVTHAGNASDWPHRAMGEMGFMTSEPGMVGTLMAEDRLAGGVIMDGFHFHPSLLAPLLHVKGPDRLVLVSDASTVAGCAPGSYQSGGLDVTVHAEGFATSGRGGGWLAGSTITLLQAVQRAISLAGIPLQQAVHMATLGPARLINMGWHKGHLEPGADADIVVLNQDLSLRSVLVRGNLFN